MPRMTHDAWPYPRWIAHRGAGLLAPENTLAAFRLGAAHGYRMAECDVKLSADGVPFLLHDATLERTTNGHGTAGHLPWCDLSQLDAGSWHSQAFSGEPLPSLAAVATWCHAQGVLLNIEIKPTPGLEAHTGRMVAQAASQLWANQAVPPLITSFRPDTLAAARAAAPHLPRGLLLDRWWPGWQGMAQHLKCVAVVAHHPMWNTRKVAEARSAALRTLSYTVNSADAAQRLLSLGLDGLITDRTDAFPSALEG